MGDFAIDDKLLTSPLTDLSSIHGLSGHVILFGCAQQFKDSNFYLFINKYAKVYKIPCFLIFFPYNKETLRLSIDELNALFDVKESALLSDFYIGDTSKRFIAYNSARDDLMLLSVPIDSISKSDLKAWDQIFIQHMKENGIGFGRAGEEYATQLFGSVDDDRVRSFPIKSRER